MVTTDYCGNHKCVSYFVVVVNACLNNRFRRRKRKQFYFYTMIYKCTKAHP